MAKDKKEKDEKYVPWKDIEAELEGRKSDVDNLMSLLRARDGAYKAEVAKLLKDGKNGLPNYNKLNRSHKEFDEGLAKKVHELADKIYSPEYDLDPFYKIFNPEQVKEGSHYRRIIENIFSKHKADIKRGVGRSDYAGYIEGIQNQANQEYQSEQIKLVVGDLNPDEHGKKVYEYVIEKTKADKKKVSEELVKNNLQNIIAQLHFGKLDADELYNLAPKYNTTTKK
jgi:hypothetical protein